MENLGLSSMLRDSFASKRVLVTGHTGFKGSWLCEWLLLLGAEVTGFSLPPPTRPSLFEQLGLRNRVRHCEADIRDFTTLEKVVRDVKPEFVFHLAAQPLVRRSYALPVETYTTNLVGTVHLLEAIRLAGTECAAVIATTDKCYENIERDHAYVESDALGGRDPYSSSKSCAELAVAAYRQSFFQSTPSTIAVATARAGNVLGGGDWAEDRIVPDCIRSLDTGEPIRVRNPEAVRPWQHVLESLSGYLVLASELKSARSASNAHRLSALSSAFNFGPQPASQRRVIELVDEVLKYWPGRWGDHSSSASPHEARRLQLSIKKAADLLGWKPVWEFSQTVRQTVCWYQKSSKTKSVESLAAFTRDQIDQYTQDAKAAALPWAV